MKIYKDYDFNDLMKACWGGAVDTLKTIEENNMENELINYLFFYILEGEIPTMTELNDFLWFEDEYVFEALGITKEEEDDDEYWEGENDA